MSSAYLSPRPLLLDGCCGAGGTARGYANAGFTVVGCDVNPQPHYPYRFMQMDVFDFLQEFGHEADAIHLSPPCQDYSDAKNLAKARGVVVKDRNVSIPALRHLLRELGKPYVIENVKKAPLHASLMLCGTFFSELRVYRHRYFETSFFIPQPPHYPHRDQTPSAGNGISPKGYISMAGTGGVRGMTMQQTLAYWQHASGNEWMQTRDELKESVPWRYGRYIGGYLMAYLQAKLAARVA